MNASKLRQEPVAFILWARDHLYREADFVEGVQRKMSFRATPAEAIRAAADAMVADFTKAVAHVHGLPSSPSADDAE